MISRPELHAYCLAKPGATTDFPFDPEVRVFRVVGKIFALTNDLAPVLSVNLKCDPDWALALRDAYDAVQPGYHMNKRHWNTVTLDGTIPDAEVCAMIDHSYERVVAGLTKTQREQIER